MMSVTPFAAQVSSSLSRISREELAMSMVERPTPAQNCCRPAEEPPEATTGVGKIEVLAEGFGDDRGVGQHGGRARDLDLVPRLGHGGWGERDQGRGGCACVEGRFH